jgi:hypothetical protein
MIVGTILAGAEMMVGSPGGISPNASNLGRSLSVLASFGCLSGVPPDAAKLLGYDW